MWEKHVIIGSIATKSQVSRLGLKMEKRTLQIMEITGANLLRLHFILAKLCSAFTLCAITGKQNTKGETART